MSIAELITSIANKVKGIKDNVLAAYDVVASKNGEVPSEKTMENLPNAIASTHDTLEELTITQNGEYTPQDGVDGFSKVIANVVPSRKVVIPNNMKVTKALIVDGYWAGELVDTRFMTSMLDMFYGCKTLQQLDVSGWDTSNVTNMSFIFADCSQLHLLDVSNWDVSDVTNMSYMFRNCIALQQLDVSNWDVGNVTNMNTMFTQCSSLQSLDVSNWDVSNVTDMGGLFYMCNTLQQLDVSNWDVSSVINISAMFYYCTSLKQLDVSNWDVSSVTNMSNLFSKCTQLQSLDVSNWDVSSVTNMSDLFYNCIALQQLDVSNWDVSNVTNFSFMLSFCTNLQWIDTTNWDLSSATNIGYTFRECHILTSMIGNRTIEDVIANNISALKGLNINVPSTTFLNSPNIDRASLRAIINGLADRTGQNALTLTLGATLIAKLTEEDIAIATNKNWTIA